MSPFTVSIVVPVYNARQTMAACIESLLAQNYPVECREVIVVDNNSTDGSVDIIRQYPVKLLYRRDKQSSYAARNLGLEHAQGEIVLFTDADCMPVADWAAALAASFQAPQVAGAGGPVIDAPSDNDVERFIGDVQPLLNAQRLEGRYHLSLVTANAAYRRDILQQLGGFDERMFTGGDIDLSWRIQGKGLGQIVYVPEAAVRHKHRSTLKGMHRQFRRYGYCSAMMTALHRTDEDYPQTPSWQTRTLFRELRALLTYAGSFAYRNTIGVLQKRTPYERKKPALWFVAETGALLGRGQAMLETRAFTRPPNGLPRKPQ